MRFYQARIISGITIDELATRLNITGKQYLEYEDEIKIPPISFLKEFCRLTNILANYVCELIDNPLPPGNYEIKKTNIN